MQSDVHITKYMITRLTGRSRSLDRSGCGSILRVTDVESRPGRMFDIRVVHIQCSKLFKSPECAPDSGIPSVAMIVPKAT